MNIYILPSCLWSSESELVESERNKCMSETMTTTTNVLKVMNSKRMNARMSCHSSYRLWSRDFKSYIFLHVICFFFSCYFFLFHDVPCSYFWHWTFVRDALVCSFLVWILHFSYFVVFYLFSLSFSCLPVS